jgi:predicted RNA binding protein YcfA (HicA-like mRNA interferase family)
MPAFGPIKQKELVRLLRLCGFDGPYSGGRHPFMIKGDHTITIPNPHHKDIEKQLLSKILKQAGIGREVWEKL